MKLIIDIPDYELEEVKNGSIASSIILKAVKDGTPIKDGDLISRSALKDGLAKHPSILNFEWNYDNLIASIIDNAPTVEFSKEICSVCGRYIREKGGADMRGDKK